MAVTLPDVLKTNPVGAVNIIVPNPTSRTLLSLIIGPVSDVKVLVVLSAEIADPPEAGVTETIAANTEGVATKKPLTTNVAAINAKIVLF